jgi:hypothetical protein
MYALFTITQKRQKSGDSTEDAGVDSQIVDGDASDARNRQLYDKAQKSLQKKGGKPAVASSLSATIPGRAKTGTDKAADATGWWRCSHAPARTCLTADDESIGMNVRTIVSVTLVIVLLMFAVHCTWVTSNAYSSPSIVLASYRDDGFDAACTHTNVPLAVRVRYWTTSARPTIGFNATPSRTRALCRGGITAIK